jgi:hypothetical protein
MMHYKKNPDIRGSAQGLAVTRDSRAENPDGLQTSGTGGKPTVYKKHCAMVIHWKPRIKYTNVLSRPARSNVQCQEDLNLLVETKLRHFPVIFEADR